MVYGQHHKLGKVTRETAYDDRRANFWRDEQLPAISRLRCPKPYIRHSCIAYLYVAQAAVHPSHDALHQRERRPVGSRMYQLCQFLVVVHVTVN